VLHSSKLAAVLRKLHNANDMLHSSAYETSKPLPPNVDETSVMQCSPNASFASNDDCQQGVEQLSDVQKEVKKMDVNPEPSALECPATKVISDNLLTRSYTT